MLFSVLLATINIAIADPVKVVVLDSGLNLSDRRFTPYLCKEGHYDATNTSINDFNGHGTHVAGLIVQYAKKSNYCLIIIKAFLNDKSSNIYYLRGLRKAVESGATIVNISGGGTNILFQEALLIQNNPEITFIVAAGNNSKNIDNPKNYFYPASYPFKNIITIGSMKNNTISEFSNYGILNVDEYENGENVLSTLPGNTYGTISGTSQATALHTGKYIYKHYGK